MNQKRIWRLIVMMLWFFGAIGGSGRAEGQSVVLTYDANGGAWSANATTTQRYMAGEWVSLLRCDGTLTRPACTLAGWSLSPNGEEDPYSMGAMMAMPETDVTLYAVWAPWTDPAAFSTRVINGMTMITGFSDTGRAAEWPELVIPDRIGNQPVQGIADKAFFDNDALRSVIFNPSLRYISAHAFAQCDALTRITFLDQSFQYMEDSAFAHCPNLKEMRVHACLQPAFHVYYNAALADQYMRLCAAKGPKIVLIGGSSLAYGLKIQRLAAAFPGYTVVNLGLSTQYGMAVQLDLIDDHLQPGDWVICVPEYMQEMYLARETDYPTVWHFLESQYDALADIDISQNPHVLALFPTYLQQKRNYLPGYYLPYANYTRDRFDAYGEFTLPRQSSIGPSAEYPSASLVTEIGAARFTEAFAAWEARGVQVAFSFPPCSRGTNLEGAIQRCIPLYQRVCDQVKHCVILGTPWDFMQVPKQFFNSNYHLTDAGAEVYTDQLAERLQAVMNDG